MTTEEGKSGNAWKTKSKPILANSSRRNYSRGDSDVSQSSDKDHDSMTVSHDMVTGANPTLRTVPVFLNGRPMHSRTDTTLANRPSGPRDQHKL